MFCPKCGKPDQSPESYCRGCGTYLPDLTKPVKGPAPPEQHVTANIVLSSMTIFTSFTLAILLWSTLAFRPDTHPLIYVTAGLLGAMGCWHVQTLWRTILLRKHLKNSKPSRENELETNVTKGKLLDQANFENIVPTSVTNRTTKHLADRHKHSS